MTAADAEIYRNSRAYGLDEAAKARAAGIKDLGVSARYWQSYLADIRKLYCPVRRASSDEHRAHLERCLALQAVSKGIPE